MSLDLYKENAKLEQQMLDDGVARFKAQIESSRVNKKTGNVKRSESQSAYGAVIIRETVKPLSQAIVKFCEMSVYAPGRTPYGLKRLLDFDPQVAAFIASKSIIDSLSNPTKFVTLAMSIGRKLYDNEYMENLRGGEHVSNKTGEVVKTKLWYDVLEKDLNKKGTIDYTHKANVFRDMGRKIGKRQEISDDDVKAQAEIGKCLIDLFRLETGLVERVVETKGKKRVAYLYPSALAEDTIQDLISEMQDMSPDSGPMVVPPRIWSDPFNGGYRNDQLRAANPLIHSQSKLQYNMMQDYNYAPLNAMCQSPWRINTSILEVLLQEAKKEGSDVLPSAEPFVATDCPIQMPETCKAKGALGNAIRRRWFQGLDDVTRKEFLKWKDDSRQCYTDDKKRFSQRSQLSRVIKIAMKYAHYDALWFNYFLDYRGRKYAIGTLSPQGADFAKALIEPRDSQLLGKHGLKWMCIHTTGVYGNDKITIPERVAWCYQNKAAIHAVADDPFGQAYDFWKGADKPFQFVAACKELSRVWKEIDAGFPAEWLSSRMVAAQDGSCNGIQHFSAMLKDEIGGAAVNLVNRSTKPNDIYGDVAKVVIPKLKGDFEPETIPLAQVLLDLAIDRSTCKRQTMIIPYGGTLESCKEYSKEWVADRFTKLAKGDDKDKRLLARAKLYGIQKLGAYLAKHVWAALQEVVVGSLKAMKFIQQCSRAVVAGEKGDKKGSLIWWKTAIGFPVVQDVKQTKDLVIDTRLCGKMQMSVSVPIDKINKVSMKSKIAPNFVHGNDSCHMSLCIIDSLIKEIDFFACIHDSYGTHVGRSEDLAESIRESFLDLYINHQPLKAFWKHCKELWEQYEKPAIKDFPSWESLEIHMGNLDLEEVRKSATFFL